MIIVDKSLRLFYKDKEIEQAYQIKPERDSHILIQIVRVINILVLFLVCAETYINRKAIASLNFHAYPLLLLAFFSLLGVFAIERQSLISNLRLRKIVHLLNSIVFYFALWATIFYWTLLHQAFQNKRTSNNEYIVDLNTKI